MFLVCRESEEEERGAVAHSGSLSSKAPALAQPALGALNCHTSHLKACQWVSSQHELSPFQRLQTGILFHIGFLNFLN